MENLDGKFVVRGRLGESGTPFFATTPEHGSFIPMYFDAGEEKCKRVFKKLSLFNSNEEAIRFIENEMKRPPNVTAHSLEVYPANWLWQKIESVLPYGVDTQMGR